jgi:hypothetical protein
MRMTIEEFCDKYNACSKGRKWAIGTGLTTMADLWKREDMRYEWREWIATRQGVLTDRELRLYACWCVRQVWHLLEYERSRHAVEVAERYAVGEATNAELAAAGEAACEAAWESAGEASEARAAAWAARAAAREAAGAAWEAARAAAWEAAGEAGAAQSAWLIANTKPKFEVSQ